MLLHDKLKPYRLILASQSPRRQQLLAESGLIAMKRRGVSQEIRTATNEAFKLLISEDYNTTQAIEKIKAEIPMNEYIEKMIDFIQTSKRGVLLKTHKSGYQSLSEE